MAKTHATVDNMQDVMDSRDIIARIEELESERQDLADAVQEAKDAQLEESSKESGGDTDTLETLKEELETAEEALKEWDGADELKALQALAEEASQSPDWTYGETLIRDSYFERYAQELADDIGAINKDATWPNDCIDWERAARELQMDYTQVDFDGVTYWIRS